MTDDGNQIRVVVLPLSSESETSQFSPDKSDTPDNRESNFDTNDLSLHELSLSFNNPSENNNAKRTRSPFSSCSSSSMSDGNPRSKCSAMYNDDEDMDVLFPKLLRTEKSDGRVETDASLRVYRSRSRDNLLFGDLVRTALPPIRPALSVGSFRLPELPHSTLPRHPGHRTSYRKTSNDILEELRRTGLLKERPAGIAFEIPFFQYCDPPSDYPPCPAQKPKQVFGRLQSRKNTFDADSFMKRIEERQQTANKRSNKVTSGIKERLGLQVKHLGRDEDYKQRATEMRIIEKEAQCAANKERQEKELRRRIREKRRRREKMRKRAKRRKTKQIKCKLQDEHCNQDVANDHYEEKQDVYEYSDEFYDSSPR